MLAKLLLLLVLGVVLCAEGAARRLASFDVGATGIVVRDGVVFRSGPGGVKAWNVTEPSAPKLIGGSPSADVENAGLTLHGNLLLVSTAPGSWPCCNALQILDITDPSNIRNVSYVDLGPGSEDNMVLGQPAVLGNVAYVGSRGGLNRVDITDPHSPKRLPKVNPTRDPLSTETSSVKTDGRNLYVGTLNGVVVFNVSFSQVAHFTALNQAVDAERGVLVVLDVNYTFYNSTTFAPLGTADGSLATASGVGMMDAAGGLLVTGGVTGVLTVVDYSDLKSVHLRDTIYVDNIRRMYESQLVGSTLFVAGMGAVDAYTGF